MDRVLSAIEAEIGKLEKLGVEKGSPTQVTRKKNTYWYLVTSQGRGVKAKWTRIDPQEVPRLKAAHKRWKQRRELMTTKKFIEESFKADNAAVKGVPSPRLILSQEFENEAA